MKLNRRVVDHPKNGAPVSFSPKVEGDAEKFAHYYRNSPEVIQRLAARGYVEVELKSDPAPQEPTAPRRKRTKKSA